MAKIIFSLTEPQVAAIFFFADGGLSAGAPRPSTLVCRTLCEKNFLFSPHGFWRREYRITEEGRAMHRALKYLFTATYPKAAA